MSKYILLLIGIISLSSCHDNNIQTIDKGTLLDLVTIQNAIEEYNQTKNLDQHEGAVINGAIDINQLNRDGKLFLEFSIIGENAFRKFGFQCKDSNKIDKIPHEIKNGRIVFLGDNLIVDDLDKQETYTFLLDGFKNRTNNPNIFLGIGLSSRIFSDRVSLRSSGGVCLCFCTPCIRCNWNCGTVSASCSCQGGGSDSITCVNCYNAGCGQCSSE